MLAIHMRGSRIDGRLQDEALLHLMVQFETKHCVREGHGAPLMFLKRNGRNRKRKTSCRRRHNPTMRLQRETQESLRVLSVAGDVIRSNPMQRNIPNKIVSRLGWCQLDLVGCMDDLRTSSHHELIRCSIRCSCAPLHGKPRGIGAERSVEVHWHHVPKNDTNSQQLKV